jgi:hypothetical protein
VTASVGGADPYLDVSEAFVNEQGVATAPTALGGQIDPGTSIHEAIMDALFAVFDTLGPSACDAAKQRYPAPATSWLPYLYRSDLFAAIEAVDGVVSCDITAPAANHDNTVAAGAANIELLTLDPDVSIGWGTYP